MELFTLTLQQLRAEQRQIWREARAYRMESDAIIAALVAELSAAKTTTLAPSEGQS